MRDSTDAIRSLARWFQRVLGDTWDVQLQRIEPTGRPSAVIQFSPGESIVGSAYVHDITQPFQVMLYPEGQENNPRFGQLEASDLRTKIRRAVLAGSTPGKSFAWRIPFYDYADLAWDEPLPDDAEPFTYLRVLRGFDTNQQVDPEDDSLFTVIVDMPLMWSDLGDVTRFVGPKLTDTSIAHQPVEDLAPPSP